MTINLIKNRNYFLGFSSVMVIASIVSVVFFDLKEGIDLRGGTQWQFAFSDSAVTERMVLDVLKDALPQYEASVKRTSSGDFLVRTPPLLQGDHEIYQTSLSKLGNIEEKSFSSIGPTVGAELRRKAIWAIILVLVGISLYIAYAFRKVSKPVKSWKYGIATLISLFHDVAIPTGLLAILGAWKGIEIDTNFIVALLVVMGFSVHDTIVVFDRIRENLLVNKGRKFLLEDIINKSVNDTMARSVNTSFTLVLVLVALIFVGPSPLFYFVITILVGTIFGTYSSIFVASPLLYLWGRQKSIK